MKISRCLVLLGVVISSEAFFKTLLNGGRNLTKSGVLEGASAVSAGVGAANAVVQFGTKLVSNGANKGAEISNNILTGATALTGMSLVTSAKYVNKGIEMSEKLLGIIPVIGGLFKLGTTAAKKSVNSMNLLGQSSLNAVDNVGTSSIGFANRMSQIGARGASGSSTIATGLTQTGLALGATAANTGIDFTSNTAEKMTNRLLRVKETGETKEESIRELLTDNLVDAVERIAPQVSSTIQSRL